MRRDATPSECKGFPRLALSIFMIPNRLSLFATRRSAEAPRELSTTRSSLLAHSLTQSLQTYNPDTARRDAQAECEKLICSFPQPNELFFSIAFNRKLPSRVHLTRIEFADACLPGRRCLLSRIAS